ncbi:hypothetical protein B0T22DRAFT_498222 [Podospora appendiculata]|uniref:NAD-dependent epimerase/dehydratase domain-containing protein n=1 Tax=Podospora appendiculata TaxID=314037 RepID=A0AAE0X8D7_9PEZI|nr:hypothetical protein B0T22DRAFT_498222 [Podospora appendiculata]
MPPQQTSIPTGSRVLVTGATGFVASHVIKQFLERGYKVRGTVRDFVKASWLVDDVFKPYAETGQFELALVPDLGSAHAFDDAIKGISAIAHIATILSWTADPHEVIPQVVAGTRSILEAALNEPSVREFVYTSSIAATTMYMPGNDTHVERDSWNDIAVQQAWAPPPYEPSRAPFVYMASKVAAEKEAWRFAAERKPHFTINTVVPGTIIGQPLNKKHAESKVAWIRQLYEGDVGSLGRIPAVFCVDVKDVALLHLAAILDPSVKNARLQAWGHACNWNDMLTILRKLCPTHEFVPDLPNLQQLNLSTDFSQPFALLERWAGQDGWRALDETIAENVSFFS